MHATTIGTGSADGASMAGLLFSIAMTHASMAALLGLALSGLACAERIDDEWKLVAPDTDRCHDQPSFVVARPGGGVDVHASLADALGFGEDRLAFGHAQIEQGLMIPTDDGWLVSVPGPAVPKRWAATHVYSTPGAGAELEPYSHGGMVAGIDARGVLSFTMCFWYERGSPRPTVIRWRALPDDDKAGEPFAGPFYGVCLSALAEDEDGVLWATARRYETHDGSRAEQDVDEYAHYLARISPEGSLHYEHQFQHIRFAGDVESDYATDPGLTQLVIDGPNFYVSGPGMHAIRLTRTPTGFDEHEIVPKRCKTSRRAHVYPRDPLPPPDHPN